MLAPIAQVLVENLALPSDTTEGALRGLRIQAHCRRCPTYQSGNLKRVSRPFAIRAEYLNGLANGAIILLGAECHGNGDNFTRGQYVLNYGRSGASSRGFYFLNEECIVPHVFH